MILQAPGRCFNYWPFILSRRFCSPKILGSLVSLVLCLERSAESADEKSLWREGPSSLKAWRSWVSILLGVTGPPQIEYSSQLHWRTRWWFQIFFIFTPTWGRFPIWPIWLIFFKGVEATNQRNCEFLSHFSRGIFWRAVSLNLEV